MGIINIMGNMVLLRNIWINSFLMMYIIVFILFQSQLLYGISVHAYSLWFCHNALSTVLYFCAILFQLLCFSVNSVCYFYSNLSLNFLTLNPIKTSIIPISTSVSFQTYIIPTPFNIIFFTITIKYFGGIR